MVLLHVGVINQLNSINLFLQLLYFDLTVSINLSVYNENLNIYSRNRWHCILSGWEADPWSCFYGNMSMTTYKRSSSLTYTLCWVT